MLNFFRKYQRYFFVVVGVVVISSFVFFGTFSTLQQPGSSQEMSVSKKLQNLLGKSCDDRSALLQGHLPQFLGDAILRKEILATHLAEVIFEKHRGELEEHLGKVLKLAKTYTPYVHPHARFISSEAVWDKFLPEMKGHLVHLKQGKPDHESFSHLVQLYLCQAEFPADILRNLLYYQESSQPKIQKDPLLASRELSLFGLRSLEEWFSPRFVEIAVECILKGALCAEEEGIAVPLKEAREDFFQKSYQNLLSFFPNRKISQEEFSSLVQSQLQQIGLDEMTASMLWQKTLLFSRYLASHGQEAISRAEKEGKFLPYAGEKLPVSCYQLPTSLQLSSFREMLKLQLYLELVYGVSKKSVALPQKMLSLQEIEKRAPELICRKYTLEIASVRKEDLAAKFSLKEIWEWEASDKGFSEILKEFPHLNASALDSQSSSVRAQIDRFAGKKMLEERGEITSAALHLATPQTRSLSLRMQGGGPPLVGIVDHKRFAQFLEEAKEGPMTYCDDGNTLYQITVKDRSTPKEVLTFSIARSEDVLGQLLDRRLETSYLEVRKKYAELFCLPDGSFKPFYDVKDDVGKIVYADLGAPSHRLVSYMKEAKCSLEEGREDFVAKGDGIDEQFKLHKSEVELKKFDQESTVYASLRSLFVDSFSDVVISPIGNHCFYAVRGAAMHDEQDGAHAAKAQLEREVKQQLISQLLEE